MAKRQVPLLNRHIRALSQRTVNGAPLSHNMLSWAKQHVEWSLAEGDYTDPDGVLMLVIDINGNAAMTVGSYEPLGELTAGQLTQRAEDARAEQAETGVAPEVLCAVQEGSLHIVADADESLCGSMTLVVQLAETLGHDIVFANSSDALAGARFLVSDEHGVVLAADCADEAPEDLRFAPHAPVRGRKALFLGSSRQPYIAATSRKSIATHGAPRHNGDVNRTVEGAAMPLIYIVEDDAAIRAELAQVLERNGYETASCATFDTVVGDIVAANPDLVLLDLTLPGTDGQFICRELRERSEVPSSCSHRASPRSTRS